MTVVALLPGGWHGPDCWDLVGAELAARGHTPVAVDLPTADPAAGAEAYAAAVQSALAGAVDAVLVAHSLAGLTAPLVPGVRHVVYVAAMLPEPGRSVDDRARAGERMTRRGIGRGQTAGPDGATRWDPDAAVEWLYPDSPPALARAAAARLRPQQWRITAEPSPLAAWPEVPGTYVLCREDRIIDTDWARAAAARRGLDLVELPGDHCPFLARPAQLAEIVVHSGALPDSDPIR